MTLLWDLSSVFFDHRCVIRIGDLVIPFVRIFCAVVELFGAVIVMDARGKMGFFAMISNIDDNMGWLMEELDTSGLAENTILIFTTDNGSVGSAVFNAGMKGGKTSVNEGGSRVPFFVRWP